MLLGAQITIHTDHEKILKIGDLSQRRLQWISYVDEYGPTLVHIEGTKNIVADQFSRMPLCSERESLSVGKKSATLDDNRDITVDSDPLDNHHVWIDDIREFIDCFSCLAGEDCYLNLPS